MADQLTAQALHDLYAPLFDKIGWPKFMRDFRTDGSATFERELRFDRELNVFMAYNVAIDMLDPELVYIGEAAALCRVAAEDWLNARGGWLIPSWYGWHCDKAVLKSTDLGRPDGRWFSTCSPGRPAGVTWETPLSAEERSNSRHDALVSACLAVAEAKP